jgi:hypothetical protein
MGCDMAQGYLFAKPMPLGQFIGTMRKRLVPVPAPVGDATAGNFVPKFSR